MGSTQMTIPGSERHQELLRLFVDFFKKDERVLAITVFGSLAANAWDRYSDLDLDVVASDTAQFDVRLEVEKFTSCLQQEQARSCVVIPNGPEEVDVVLGTLEQFSVRFHKLSATSPNIVQDFILLWGTIDKESIRSAGLANRKPKPVEPRLIVDKTIRCLLETNVAIQRERIWAAVELLHYFRGLLMDLYTLTHGGIRSYQYFERHAPSELQQKVGATLPGFTLATAREALACSIRIVSENLRELSDGKTSLSGTQRDLLEEVGRLG